MRLFFKFIQQIFMNPQLTELGIGTQHFHEVEGVETRSLGAGEKDDELVNKTDEIIKNMIIDLKEIRKGLE